MSKTKQTLLLISIVFLAAVLRLFALGQAPPSPDWDEVALGYNAHSLMETGKDEYGQSFPIIFRSFDDYKPGLYVYLVMPFVKIFGLTVQAVRLPSALLGTLTVLATFFIVKELLSYGAERTWKQRLIPFGAAFLLAISPWHLQFSRIGFESNSGLALNVFAILFFLKGLRKAYFLPLSVFCLGLSLYAYQAEKVFVPLLALVLAAVFRKELLVLPKKYLLVSLIIGLIIALPILSYTFTNTAALSRAQGVSIFTDETPFVKEYTKRIVIDKETSDFLGLIFDNRRVAYAKAFLNGYLSHFSINWLFTSGDIERHHAPQMGLLYLWELPFLLIGIYQFIFGNYSKKMKLFVFLWFFITPIAASFTTGVPHAVRTLNFLPTFQIFTAIGTVVALTYAWRFRPQKKIRYVFLPIFVFVFVLNIAYFLDQYFVQQNYFYSQAWQYGYKEGIIEVQKIENKYDKIIVSNKPHLDQSYIFFLFYLKYPPKLYQEQAKDVSGGFREDHAFGKYEFRSIDWANEKKDGSVLYFGRPEDFDGNTKIIKMIHFLNGKEAIWIVEG